jgi:hypothetical protein
MRFIIDEASFDLDELPEPVVADAIIRLSGMLAAMREVEPGSVGILSGWGALGCWSGMDVAAVLTTCNFIDRDERMLLLGLLDKCIEIDDDVLEASLEPEMIVASAPVTSYGLALTHHKACSRPAECCGAICLAHQDRRGEMEVARAGGTDRAPIMFVVDSDDAPLLWRTVICVENVPESGFFELVGLAFPKLLFHPSLNFSRFQGGYAAVRDEVVRHLSRLNDCWTSVFEAAQGQPDPISARLGIAVSLESPRTRASESLMKERDVEFDDQTFRCEWHSKLEPHQNRIHFHPATQGLEFPLIGIFASHLATKG